MIVQPQQNAQLQQQINNWKVRDNGIDPRSDIFALQRRNEEVGGNDCLISSLRHLFCAFTFPVSLFMSKYTVRPMHDTVFTECGVITEVLRVPGVYLKNPCCLGTTEVFMGTDDMEIGVKGVNDSVGNPLDVSAQFTYRVIDSVSVTYKAANVKKFLQDQGLSALRQILSQYPYDINGSGECLRRHSETINRHLAATLQVLVDFIGVKVDTFTLTSVGYEHSMEKLLLAKQEAQAEVTARTAIAEGVSGIVKETLSRLKALGIDLTEEDRNQFAMRLTLILVNHGHTSLNIFDNNRSNYGNGKAAF